MPETPSPSAPGDVVLPLPRRAGPPREPRNTPQPARTLSLEQVSDLLWAGFGLNRHGSGGRAAIPARGWRALELYVCLPDGCYRYDARDHALLRVTPRDARAFAGWHGAGPPAALALVYVTDRPDDERDAWEETGHLAGAEVPAIAGNVAAHSARAGLSTRGEERFDPRLANLLGLDERQRIVLTQTIALRAAVH